MYAASARETLATPLVVDQYGIPDDSAVFYCSTVISATGLFSIFVLMGVTRTTKHIDTRKVMILFGFIPVLLGMFLHYPIGNKDIVLSKCTNVSSAMDSTTQLPYVKDTHSWSNFQLTDSDFTSSDPSSTDSNEKCNGCPYDLQPWCLNTPQITPTQLIITYVITTAGFGISMSYSQAVYTRILGPIPLGVWMSLLAACSATARITGPIWSSYVYENYGTKYTYIILGCIETFAALVLILSFKNLAPMTPITKKTSYDNPALEDQV